MPVVAISSAGWFWLIVLALAVIVFVIIATNYRKVGPNQVLIVSGGPGQRVTEPDGSVRRVGYKMRIGGGAVVWPFFQTAEVLPLEIFTVHVKAEEALTKNGVLLNAEGLAQVKIGSSEAEIRRAAEQFLGRGADAIRDVGGQVLEGLLKAYLGSATVKEIYQNRDEFNQRMAKDAVEEFGKMGLDVISFALVDISDNQGYIDALGQPEIAAVKGAAEVSQAETDRDAAMKTADARKTGDIAKLKAEQEVAQASCDFEIARAGFAADVNKKKAGADMAYDLERQKGSQSLKAEEVQVRIVERQKMIELEELEIARKEKELAATVEKTAEARQKQVRIESQAESYRLEAEAKGKAAAAKLAAEAEAEAIRLRGKAEAEAMQMKADSFREYNEAAVYQMLVEILPDLAKAVSEPLSKVDKITIVDTGGDGQGVSKITGQVAQVLGQLPEVVESLGGVDLKKLAKKLTKKVAESKEGESKKGED